MAALKTNYVDDVLNTSVNEKRKYNMVQNADGTVSFDDVTTYTQNGDLFGAKDINDTNTAVNVLNENLTAFDVDTQTYSTETFKFAKSGEDLGMLDEEGNFMAFGGSGKIYYLGQGTSFDIKSLLPQKYADLTAENFLVSMKSISIAADSGNANSASTTSDFVKTYKDGVLTIKNIYTALRKTGEAYYEYITAKATLTCEVYLVIGEVPFLKFIV